MAASYAERAFELLDGQEEILRWLVWTGPRSLEELREFYRHWHLPSEEGDSYRFAIVERGSEALVGAVDLSHLGHPGTGDIGYWIGQPYQGRGFMVEAAALTIWFAFQHLETSSLAAWAFVGNTGSRKVLERNGFRLVRTALGRRYDERVVDEWSFALTRAEWLRSRGPQPDLEDVRFLSPD